MMEKLVNSLLKIDPDFSKFSFDTKHHFVFVLPRSINKYINLIL